jgi:hypothetical protein
MALEGFDGLDPAITDDAYEATVITQLFSGLVRADADLNVLPDVAHSWRISPDGLEYIFSLREDARFHNGRNITAEDFIYSFSRLLDQESVPPGIIQDYLIIVDGAEEVAKGHTKTVRGLIAPDPHTLIIRLAKPYPSFLSVLCMDQAKVVPREEVERLGGPSSAAAGGLGPFRPALGRTVLILLAIATISTPAYPRQRRRASARARRRDSGAQGFLRRKTGRLEHPAGGDSGPHAARPLPCGAASGIGHGVRGSQLPAPSPG